MLTHGKGQEVPSVAPRLGTQNLGPDPGWGLDPGLAGQMRGPDIWFLTLNQHATVNRERSTWPRHLRANVSVSRGLEGDGELGWRSISSES